MNIFIKNTKIVVFFSCILSTVIFIHGQGPISTVAAYTNKISQISHSIGSHDQYAITFVCQKDPICMYTPLSYEEIDGDSLTKSYFLPRVKYTDLQLRYMKDDLRKSCKSFGIDLQIDEIKEDNYGLRMSFTMQNNDDYDIIKVIDSDSKSVRFDIVAKI